MKYALIGNDGQLDIKDGDWRPEVGPEGPARVRLAQTDGYAGWSGWVNDCGHLAPDTYLRNLVGGLVLTGMGAAVQPYAGPVVLTGWNPHGMPTEVCGLDDLQIRAISGIHYDARIALAGSTEPWAADARRLAEHMRTAPAPTLTITSDIDLFGGRA